MDLKKSVLGWFRRRWQGFVLFMVETALTDLGKCPACGADRCPVCGAAKIQTTIYRKERQSEVEAK
jgi:hypothetical protein